MPKESRIVFIAVEKQSETNKYYIKNRKTHKICSTMLNEVLTSQVTVSIVSAIVRSIEKDDRLKLKRLENNTIIVTDPIAEEEYVVDEIENVIDFQM